MPLPDDLAAAIDRIDDVLIVEPKEVMTLGTVVRLDGLDEWSALLGTTPAPRIVIACAVTDRDGNTVGHTATVAHAGVSYSHVLLDDGYHLTNLDSADSQDDEPLFSFGFDDEEEDGEDGDWRTDWANRAYMALSDELKQVVDEVIERPDYAGWGDDHIIRNAYDLPPNDFTSVVDAATEQYRQRVVPRLEDQARLIISKAKTYDDFHPAGHIEPLYERAVEELDVDARAMELVRNVADEYGLGWEEQQRAIEQFRRELEQLITEVFDQETLDRLGFTTRKQLRHEMLQPLYDRHPETLHDQIYKQVRQIDNDKYALERERRFLAAVDLLIERGGWTKAATARELGLPASAIDRLYRDHTPDMTTITSDDWLHDFLVAKGVL